jgi:ABC-type cobalamin/Fe3+-siderophores transport system ATPase subunit
MSTYSEFSKGSEWRKWDLHIHTPLSICQNYGGDKKWDEFIEALEHLPQDVKIIGINDYYFIDGYERVMQYKKRGRLSNIEKIFSVLEFRIDTFGSGNENTLQKINLHIIFNIDEKNLDIEIQKIKKEFIGLIPLSKLDKHKTKMLSIENMAVEGGDDLQNGFSNLIPPTEKVFELLNSPMWKNKHFLFLGYKEWSNLEKNQQLKPLKEDLYNRVNAFFTANIDTYSNSKRWLDDFGSKPLLHSCDIHDFDILDTACKDENGDYKKSTKYCCNTWIKADPTFEGLKQILYEPQDRVRIQESNPNTKKLYNIIEKVKFIDKSGKSKFSNNEMGFNPDLNAIIGGKSSGKSLLLHSIAKAIGNESDIKTYDKVLDGVELEVYYSDNLDIKRTPEDKRIIEFLPQNFIEKIVREKSENVKSQNYFDKFIEALIRQNKEIEDLYELHNENISNAQAKLEKSIRSWIAYDKELYEKKQDLKPLGDKKVISKEIERLQKNLEDLTKRAGLTTEEITLFKDLTTSIDSCNKRIDRFEQENLQIESLKRYLEDMFITDAINSLSFIPNDEYIERLFDIFRLRVRDAIISEKEKFEIILNEKIEKMSRIINNLQKRINRSNEKLSPILTKNQIQNEIKAIENNILSEKEKIGLIEIKEKEIIEIKKTRDGIVFIDFYKQICDSYDILANAINEKIGEKWIEGKTNLDLKAAHIFQSAKFVDAISSVINTRKYLENQFADCGFMESDYQYASNHHIDNIRKILYFCIRDEKRFNNFISSGNTEKLLKALFTDCNYIDFDIKKGDDSLQDMSEGKMGIVILQLYLSLSKADFPILIDQPEDHLDNRTVYIELNDYIKQCKQRRQIIMVSHNANLVVNTDAENVIVANQSGEDGKDNKKYKFEYVNGALENTFDGLEEKGVLYQKGIREHVCEILEGGTDAFKKREEKYNLR